MTQWMEPLCLSPPWAMLKACTLHAVRDLEFKHCVDPARLKCMWTGAAVRFRVGPLQCFGGMERAGSSSVESVLDLCV